MPASKQRPQAVPAVASFNTFKVSKQTSGRVRSKFTPQKRRQVAETRRRGACLRCSLTKMACSAGAICSNCSKLACKTGPHNRILPFSACIRTKLQEVSPFESYLLGNDPGSLELIFANGDILAATDITLDFANDVTWNTQALVNDVGQWLHNPLLSNTSKVGMMSSPAFLDTILDSSSSVDEQSGINFRLMLYATSLAHIQQTLPDGNEFDVPDLLQIGSVAGHEFLKHLDEKLKPQKLAKCTGDDIRSLFLLAFGTILAVGYANDKAPNASPETQHQFKAMQEHICQILAHYVAYLGSQLGLPLARGTEKFMLEAAPEKWRKQGIFRWSTPCSQIQSFSAAAEFPMQPGLDNPECHFAEPNPNFGAMDPTQVAEFTHAIESQNAGISVGSHAQGDLDAWTLPAEIHATDASSHTSPDIFYFPPPQIIDPPTEASHEVMGDVNAVHLNAWHFIDSVAEAGCTCRVLAEPQRTEYLLV